MKPIVSIITPLYNCCEFLCDTYHSVISQTFSNWEWIIIDDCSVDGSFELIKKLSSGDNRIVLLQNKTNSGSAYSRNRGLDIASGVYITFLDSDDLLDNNYLESQLEFISTNQPIITAGYRRMASKTITTFMPKKTINYRQLLYGCDTSCLTTMFNQNIIGNVRFNESMKKDEDFIFWLDILRKGYVVKTNCNVLATYRIRKESKNGNKKKLLKPIYNVYHNILGFGFFRTWWHIFCYFVYGVKKYRGVK